jgi:hypothetical protein
MKKFLIELKRRGFFSFVPDKIFYSVSYRLHCDGNKLHWDNPQTFAEKLSWLKLYDRKESYRQLVDKYQVRDYIRQNIGEDILIPIYGEQYDSFDEIDFAKIPEKVVIKCTHDSGSVRIVNKNTCEFNELRQFFDKRMKINYFHYAGREWAYKGLKSHIIVEKYLENENQAPLVNYKFHCFNGKPKFVIVQQGLHEVIRQVCCDFDFNPLPFYQADYEMLEGEVPKAKNIDLMLDIAEKLCKEMAYLRVDLYEVDGKVFFSELTFYPTGGVVWFEPNEWNYEIGSWLDLSGIRGR